jgi:hypothetical protein
MRDGWPVELTFLLERHPRPTWRTRDSATVAFWLAVHDHLRRAAVGLEATADDYRAARLSTTQLAVVAAPRLNGLVAGLDGHHQIEDFHYFPTFRSAEPRLATGFDRLEAEHATMAHEVRTALGALAELRAAAERGDEPHDASLAAQHFLSASAELCRHLREHLDDEEALVVPLLLERGDV